MATVAIKTNPVNLFEIPVKDMGRSKTFYEKVFGLELSPEEMGTYKLTLFPRTQKAPGATGTLIKGETYEPSLAGTVVHFSVDDIHETLIKVNANGGRTLLPKKSIGEYGFIGILKIQRETVCPPFDEGVKACKQGGHRYQRRRMRPSSSDIFCFFSPFPPAKSLGLLIFREETFREMKVPVRYVSSSAWRSS
jgi:predicted enzyme related to lactoylglutathione lyase